MAARRKTRKKSSKSEFNSAKRSQTGRLDSVAKSKSKGQPSSSSLFENLWTQRKFDVLGKKRKGEGRRVGLSRSLAIEKRQKTLLQEFKGRGKTNTFVDHRFGESDETLAEEDKAILRFQRERQAQWQRRTKFTLPDDDDDDDEALLTHRGTALSMLDDFNENISVEDDDDGQDLDEEIVRQLHFGGGSANDNKGFLGEKNDKKPRSKKEVMEEIIAKSKLYKAQKAKEKEEDAELKAQLDKDFAALTQSQALISLLRHEKGNAVKSMLGTFAGKEATISVTSNDAADGSHEKEKHDDFDKLVKEMGMEMRAYASDRLKTDEEMAREEKARLEELEEKRKKRMLGESDSEDSEVNEMKNVKISSKRKGKRLEISGDDLGENFLMDDGQPEKGWIDEILARTTDNKEEAGEDDGNVSDVDNKFGKGDDNEGNGSSSDEVSSEDEPSEKAWEESDEDRHKELADTSLLKQSHRKVQQDEANKIVQLKEGSLIEAQGLMKSFTASQLPYVIEAPKSLEELKVLVDGQSVEDLLVVIQRIRSCNAIRLAAENRKKMQVFYGVLLQYFASIAGQKVPGLDRLNALVKPLIEMTSETPYFAAVCARERIVHMQHQLSEKLQNSDANGPWPSLRTLLLLRLWSMIFPTSDFRHVVMTPSILLMSEYLVRCPVTSGRDVAVGTFLCALLLCAMRQAKRFCPEALSFLHAVLISAVTQRASSGDTVDMHGCAAFMVDLVASQPWLLVQSDCSAVTHIQELDFIHIMLADSASPFFDTDRFRIAMLKSVLMTLNGFAHIYNGISCYPEVFKPFIRVLQNISAERLFPQFINVLMNELLQQLKDNISKHERLRQPLRMRVKKPTPIKQFNPKFEEDFVQGRNYDPDRERAERKKLQRLLKQEARGATRELRKDNYFLQEEKAKEKVLIEEHRDEKYRKAMAFLQEQEAAFKSGQLGKGRKRRR